MSTQTEWLKLLVEYGNTGKEEVLQKVVERMRYGGCCNVHLSLANKVRHKLLQILRSSDSKTYRTTAFLCLTSLCAKGLNDKAEEFLFNLQGTNVQACVKLGAVSSHEQRHVIVEFLLLYSMHSEYRCHRIVQQSDLLQDFFFRVGII